MGGRGDGAMIQIQLDLHNMERWIHYDWHIVKRYHKGWANRKFSDQSVHLLSLI